MKSRSRETVAVDGRRARGDRTRKKVLDASVEQASRLGLEGVTLGTVAKEAGISKGAITVLFGDKQALQLATLEAAVDRFRVEVAGLATSSKSKLQIVSALLDRWFDFVEEKKLPGGCFIHATVSEYRAREGAVRDRVGEHRRTWRGAIERLLREARTAGELEEGTDVAQLAFELLACQAAADCAGLYGDHETFARARRTAKKRLASASRAKKSASDAKQGKRT